MCSRPQSVCSRPQSVCSRPSLCVVGPSLCVVGPSLCVVGPSLCVVGPSLCVVGPSPPRPVAVTAVMHAVAADTCPVCLVSDVGWGWGAGAQSLSSPPSLAPLSGVWEIPRPCHPHPALHACLVRTVPLSPDYRGVSMSS